MTHDLYFIGLVYSLDEMDSFSGSFLVESGKIWSEFLEIHNIIIKLG